MNRSLLPPTPRFNLLRLTARLPRQNWLVSIRQTCYKSLVRHQVQKYPAPGRIPGASLLRPLTRADVVHVLVEPVRVGHPGAEKFAGRDGVVLQGVVRLSHRHIEIRRNGGCAAETRALRAAASL